MLLARLMQFFRGYLIITVSGRYPERFLNVCSKRKILIWDVFPCSAQIFRCAISVRGFKMLPPIAKKTAVHIKIVKKKGLPILLSQYKKRKLFLVGLIAFLVAFIALNQFIWKIDIIGNESLTETEIMSKLEECGLKIGSFRPIINEQKLKNDMLIKMPELAWLWADKSGSKVVVEVKERKPKPEIYDTNAMCNIVATKDGVIDSMIVTYGAPMVALGDTVRAGDILVSGLLISEKNAAPRTVQSDAKIYARVWYEKTRAYSLVQPIYRETGQVENKYTLHIFGRNIKLFRNEESRFTLFRTEEQKRDLSVFGWYLGIGISQTTNKEQTVDYETLSVESAAQTCATELSAEIDAETDADASLTERQSSYQVIDEETIEVTVVAEYLENIAQKTEILPQAKKEE